jgi:hypothetical protein
LALAFSLEEKMKRLVIVVVMLLLLSGVVHAQLSLNADLQKQLVMTNLSAMPLSFTENRGQWDEKALFKAEAGGATFFFCKDEVAYVFARNTNELIDDGIPQRHDMPKGIPDKFNHPRYKKESMVLYARFVGATADPRVIAEDRLGYNCNYFYGNDPSKWRTDVPNYSAITYKDIYPGIDLKYHGDGKGMKYDFIVNPGANISQISIKYDGVENLSITNQGDLEAQTKFGPVYEKIPQIYQKIDGQKSEISGQYVLHEPGIFGFVLEDGFNPAYPVVIDPELVYSTYLAWNTENYGRGIAVDQNGNSYITGSTFSGYPGTAYDVFVTKVTPDGRSIVYNTFLGGSGGDYGNGIAVDSIGDAYVTGSTQSSDFPIFSAYDGSFNGMIDAFVTKLAPDGNSLIYSTFLGGNIIEEGYGIALDDNNSAYVAGHTDSPDFPTQYPIQGHSPGDDAFVTKFAPNGMSLVYSTFLGGGLDDYGYGVAVNGNHCAYVTGKTDASDFPVFNAYQSVKADSFDAFVTKFASDGQSLVYSTFLGGNMNDEGDDIAVDPSDHAYVTGWTASTNFPTLNPYQADQPDWDAFVTQFTSDGRSLVYSTYLGGEDVDGGHAITVDEYGCAHVTGLTWSSYFPTTPDAFKLNNPQSPDSSDAFVTILSQEGNALMYSTYWGGSADDYCAAIALDYSGNSYVTGFTWSVDFPTTPGTYQDSDPQPSYLNAFVTKLGSTEVDSFPILEFNQINFVLDGDTTLNSDYGDVDLTFMGQDSILYFNLTVDTNWVIQNIPIPSLEGIGVVQTITMSFPITSYPPPETVVTAVQYAFLLTDTILTQKPQNSVLTEAPVGQRWAEFATGLAEDGGPNISLTPASDLIGDQVNGPAHYVQDPPPPFPNQECGPGECTPAAVSNCLLFLNETKHLGIDPAKLSIDSMKTATNWGFKTRTDDHGRQRSGNWCWTEHKDPPNGHNAWWEDKKAYMANNNLPITTEVLTDFDQIGAQLGIGQMVELCTGNHTAAVKGIIPEDNGKYSIILAHDQNQWKNPGGTKGNDYTLYDPVSGKFEGGKYVDGAPFCYAVIQCPLGVIDTTCFYRPGDINGNGSVNGLDIVYAVNYFKATGNPPPIDCGSPLGPCPEPSPFYAAGDVNGNCAFNGIDITYFVRYLKGQVPSLLYCADCPPAGVNPPVPAVEPIRAPVLKSPVINKAGKAE